MKAKDFAWKNGGSWSGKQVSKQKDWELIWSTRMEIQLAKVEDLKNLGKSDPVKWSNMWIFTSKRTRKQQTLVELVESFR